MCFKEFPLFQTIKANSFADELAFSEFFITGKSNIEHQKFYAGATFILDIYTS